MKSTPIYTQSVDSQGAKINLSSPTLMPKASSFLWNEVMLVQVNCQGYVNAQFMQPEPSKYSRGPNLEAKTFMQPEQPYYTEHPGRFVYIKDNDTGKVFSVPHAPMLQDSDSFDFEVASSCVRWIIENNELRCTWTLSLTASHQVELWDLQIEDLSGTERNLSVYGCFTIGYMSWMNQSANYDPTLNAIVAKSITPYQRVEDYFKNMQLKDNTFLYASQTADYWTTSFSDFVGNKGIYQPESLFEPHLNNQPSYYESPIAVMQFDKRLSAKGKTDVQFVFGPAKDDAEVAELIRLFAKQNFHAAIEQYDKYVNSGESCIQIKSNLTEFDTFINHWLPRQVFYHGDVNRLTTDPQTRNFVQDAMGMIYIDPQITRQRILHALSQQKQSGQMPDGILLTEEAELKYINQVPHADHCVWLPLCLEAYLNETGDQSILAEQVAFSDTEQTKTVAEHIELALDWLLSSTDENGLSYIEQGDWCDPMNMVGYKGKGVSSWLTIATSYVLSIWLKLSEQYSVGTKLSQLEDYQQTLVLLNKQINTFFRDQDWFSRGITDEGKSFGIAEDHEGKMFLNPQSWALLAGIVDKQQSAGLIKQVMQHLATTHGTCMLAPAYTKMRDDVGRVTQKYPGSAENGSVYNHAAAFWSAALYKEGYSEQGFDVFDRMLPKVETALQTGQLPNFVPNYYRGARLHQPECVGFSSHLFNTGTVSWLFKIVVEEICGLKGVADGLLITPNLPEKMTKLSVTRRFRGAQIQLDIEKSADVNEIQVFEHGNKLTDNTLKNIQANQTYHLTVLHPKNESPAPQLLIVSGVSGSGKSTLASKLADKLDWVFVEADDFHSPAAKLKMANGIPLTDQDREPWIQRLIDHLAMLRVNQQPVVLAYSGLKSAHRQRFRDTDFATSFFRLDIEKSAIKSRLEGRTSHFFDSNLLDSQFAAMEPPLANETDITLLDGSYSVDELVAKVTQQINKAK